MSVDNKIAVSVIIPNYNHAKYLRQRLESVLNQTFRDFEIIILDDCSTDESVQVIESYKEHPKISQIIINNQNSGSSFLQWNKGIDLAKGKWIWMAESDDWCEPSFLETLMKKVNQDVALAFCQSLVINQEGETIWKTNWPRPFERINGKIFIADYLSKGNFIVNASMCIFNKEKYNRVSKEFMNYKFMGDWLLWMEISALGDVIVSGERLNYFRKHDRDVSGNAYKEGLGYREYFTILDRVGENKVMQISKRKKTFEHKFYEFLNDRRIERKSRRPLYLEFRSRMGVKTYFFQLKNFLVKNIKTPLFRRGKKRTEFQYYTNAFLAAGPVFINLI